MGLYRIEPGHYLFIGHGASRSDLSLTDTKSGEVRYLIPAGIDTFTHGPSRSRTMPMTGTIRFSLQTNTVTGLVWKSEDAGELAASRVPLNIEKVSFKNGNTSNLKGELITPAKEAFNTVVVAVPTGDRDTMWDVAMWLVKNGIGVFLYDRRNTGQSTGESIALSDKLSSYTYGAMIHADDAVAAVRFVRALPTSDGKSVGILGWSEGGWIGSIVALREKDLAFYVNVAANANPWPEQARHRVVARMMREGFTEKDLKEADAYFDAYAAVANAEIGWEEYVAARNRYHDHAWFAFLLKEFTFLNHGSFHEAIRHYLIEYPPDHFFNRLRQVPTLGIYFEFDQSNPTSSPALFLKAVQSAGNPAVTVRTFKGLNHGAWRVSGYGFDPSQIKSRDPAPFETIAQWILARR